jgi:hypothetical protein
MKQIFSSLKAEFYGHPVCRAVKHVWEWSRDWNCLLQIGCQVTFSFSTPSRVLHKDLTVPPHVTQFTLHRELQLGRDSSVGIATSYWLSGGHAVAQWLRHCATNRKITGSIPDGVTEIFH